MEEFVSIARIVKAHGVRGEVVALLLTDFPERFDVLGVVRLASPENAHWEELEGHRFHKGRVLLKFVGRDRPEEVEELIGCELQVPDSERVKLPEDTFYDSDLLGCEIVADVGRLGVVSGLLKTAAGTNLRVVTPENREFMVPLARAFIRKVDVEKRVIEVDLPPGLIELGIELG